MNGEIAHIGWLGYLILTIVMGSLFFIILAAIGGGNPQSRKPKVTLLVIVTIIGLFVAVVASMGIGGLIFSALMG